ASHQVSIDMPPARSVCLLAATIAALCPTGCSPGLDEGAQKPSSAMLLDASEADQLEVTLPEEADGWPRWRGVRCDGISTETAWTTTWPDEGPRRCWQAKVGTGFSSMAVTSGRLYTMGHSAPPDDTSDASAPADERDTVWCLDAETGAERWHYSYQCKRVAHLHEGGPAATPTVATGRVYTLSKEGHFLCLNAETGKLLWQNNVAEVLGIAMPEWGFSSSPLALGDLVVVEAGRLAAFEATTGKLVWQTAKHAPGYGSPVPFPIEGGLAVATLNNESLLIADALHGKILATSPWKTSHETSSTTPIVAGDTLFISTGYNRGCELLRFDGQALQVVYENKNMRNHMNTCVLWNGHLFGFDGNSSSRRNVTLNCIEHATGKKKWKRRGLGCGSLMLADGKLIILSDEGRLVVAEASPDAYTSIAEADILEGKCWTVPVLADGRLYARNAAGDLVCVDLRPPTQSRN
ncbi:MAG: PQQ-binding-like beta-propeller repeat protein, partial [Pirellulales bacterium]